MPAIGGRGYVPQAPLPKPAKPKPAPRAPSAAQVMAATVPVVSHAPAPQRTSGGPSAAAVMQATNPRTTRSSGSAVGRAITQGGKLGQAAVGAQKGVRAAKGFENRYQRALIAVFQHQGKAQQQAIIKGAQANPQSYESKTINGWLRGQSSQYLRSLGVTHIPNPEAGTGKNIVNQPILPQITNALGIGQGETFGTQLAGFGSSTQPTIAPGSQTTLGAAGQVNKLIDQIHQIGPQSRSDIPRLQEASGVPSSLTFAKNAAKDAVNFYAEAGPSVGIPVVDALQGHWGQAFDVLAQPWENFVHNPKKALLHHPLYTYLMAMGLVHPVAQAGESAVRAVARRPLNRTSTPIDLTGNFTHERPPMSKSPIMRYLGPVPGLPLGQRFREMLKFEKNDRGHLVPKSENLRARLTKMGVSRMVYENEHVRSVHHEQQMASHYDAVVRGRTAPVRFGTLHGARRLQRIAHGLKTALKNNPELPLIKGHDVLGHIVEGALGTSKTAVADLEKRIQQVRAKRGNLENLPNASPARRAELLSEHDAYVARMEKALTELRGMSPKEMATLFGVANRHVTEYKPLEGQTERGGYFAGLGMGPEELKRRTLMAAYTTHTPGAYRDDLLGIVRPGTKEEVRAFQGKLWAQARAAEDRKSPTPNRKLAQELRDKASRAWEKKVVPVTTDEMSRAVGQHVGGRTLGFLSHKPLEGDSAHFVSTQKEPRAANEHNSLFAFEHGLTEPGHRALEEQRARAQGIVDAQKGNHRIIQQFAVTDHGNPWNSYKAVVKAKQDMGEAGKDLVPFRYAPHFQPSAVLAKALEDAKRTGDLTALEEEGMRRGLNVSEAAHKPTGPDDPGPWVLIDRHVLSRLREHENLITPNIGLRFFRGMNGQWRATQLATSFRHLPGVVQEVLLRAVASGTGLVSWLAADQSFKKAAELDPELAERRRIEMTGGMVAGSTLDAMKRSTSTHYEGTRVYPVLKTWEDLRARPGVRQVGTAWRVYRKFTLGSTHRFLEQQADMAGIGKAIIQEFGGEHGLAALAMGQWGKMVDAGARGILDEQTARRFNATNRKIWGVWNGLSPHGQMAVMMSPFGMWWVNSVNWLYHLPVDHPVLTGGIATASVGTEKERQKLGLDLFAPGALPLYKQGGIPVGGSLWGANYYSPFGVANDPLETAASLVAPWLVQPLMGAYGVDWHGGPITSPAHPQGSSDPSFRDRVLAIVGSLASGFMPLYTKAQQVVEGGAPSYDTSTLWAPQTKGPNPGPVAGLKKVVSPIRIGKAAQLATGGGGGKLDFSNAGSASAGGGQLDFSNAGSASGGGKLDFSNAGR